MKHSSHHTQSESGHKLGCEIRVCATWQSVWVTISEVEEHIAMHIWAHVGTMASCMDNTVT